MRGKRVYISGPMTGIKGYNFSEFNRMERVIKECGGIPLNPAGAPIGLGYAHYMDIAFAMVRSSEYLILLDGWSQSKGAVAEHAYAESIGLKIIREGDYAGE